MPPTHTKLFTAMAAAASMPRPSAPSSRPVIQPVMELRPSAVSATEYELIIYGDIGVSWWDESVTAQDVLMQLNALDASVTQINVRINSYGGSVSDAMAIYNSLKRHASKIVVTIDGVAMSSASLIAMAGTDVLMPKTSMMMIHAPWGVSQGDANDMRVMANVLDVFATTMSAAYAAKTGKPVADMLALLSDGADHYYTGEEAVAAGFADQIADPAAAGAQAASSAAGGDAGLDRFLCHAPAGIAAQVRAAARHPIPGSAAARGAPPVAAPSPITTTPPTAAPVASTGAIVMNEEEKKAAEVAAAKQKADIHAAAMAALKERNANIKAAMQPHMDRPGISDLYTQALEDPEATVESVRTQALDLLGKNSAPVAGAGVHIEVGVDERDKRVAAGSDYLMARAGLLDPAADASARQGNPFGGMTLLDMARHCAAAAGINVRGLDRDHILAASITTSTSDFPNLLENTLHKAVISSFNSAPSTWQRFSKSGTLSDFRPHNRYYLGGFSDLKEVLPNGEYQDGNLVDANKETISAQSKGRILNLSRQILIDDDMGVFSGAAQALGQAAMRTLEKDVYALLGQNAGLGPLMTDGLTLFDSGHGNIAAVAGAPSTATFDAARVLIAEQTDPSGEILDIVPARWLGPKSIGGLARVVNESKYDTLTSTKQQLPNSVNGMYADTIDTARLSGTRWYSFANPAVEPVIEVGFLDGIKVPVIVAEDAFRSSGRAWRVTFDYGVAAINWRGATTNAG